MAVLGAGFLVCCEPGGDFGVVLLCVFSGYVECEAVEEGEFFFFVLCGVHFVSFVGWLLVFSASCVMAVIIFLWQVGSASMMLVAIVVQWVFVWCWCLPRWFSFVMSRLPLMVIIRYGCVWVVFMTPIDSYGCRTVLGIPSSSSSWLSASMIVYCCMLLCGGGFLLVNDVVVDGCDYLLCGVWVGEWDVGDCCEGSS